MFDILAYMKYVERAYLIYRVKGAIPRREMHDHFDFQMGSYERDRQNQHLFVLLKISTKTEVIDSFLCLDFS